MSWSRPVRQLLAGRRIVRVTVAGQPVFLRAFAPRLAVRLAVVCVAIAGLLGFPGGATAGSTTLQMTIVGEGTIHHSYGDCPPVCEVTFVLPPTVGGGPEFRFVGMQAIPAVGWELSGWSASPSLALSCFPTPDKCSVDVAFDAVNNGLEQVTVTFVPAPPPAPAAPPVVRDPDGAFLCYSRFQVDPGVWPEKEAAALLANGYWRPTAVPGAVSATRLGPYSLVCNPPNVARVVEHGFVDDGGVRLAGVGDPWLGLYPLAG